MNGSREATVPMGGHGGGEEAEGLEWNAWVSSRRVEVTS